MIPKPTISVFLERTANSYGARLYSTEGGQTIFTVFDPVSGNPSTANICYFILAESVAEFRFTDADAAAADTFYHQVHRVLTILVELEAARLQEVAELERLITL